MTACEWMDGQTDGWMERQIHTGGTQAHTHMRAHTHFYKADSSSVSFIALQGSGCNTPAFNRIFASHKILLCFSG